MGDLGVCGFIVGSVCGYLVLAVSGLFEGGLFPGCGSGFLISLLLLVIVFRLFPVLVLSSVLGSVVVCSKVSHSSPLFQ